MSTIVHSGPAYELSVAVTTTRYGHHLQFHSLVPTARRPEPQARFQAHLSVDDLRRLHAAIGAVLAAEPEATPGSRPEPERA